MMFARMFTLAYPVRLSHCTVPARPVRQKCRLLQRPWRTETILSARVTSWNSVIRAKNPESDLRCLEV